MSYNEMPFAASSMGGPQWLRFPIWMDGGIAGGSPASAPDSTIGFNRFDRIADFHDIPAVPVSL